MDAAMDKSFIMLVLMLVFVAKFQHSVSEDEVTSGDDTINTRIQEFSELCPYTDTCYTNASWTEEMKYLGMTACCDTCRCDPQCGLDCCPDMSLDVNNKEDLLKSKETQCVDAQYRPYGSDIVNGPSFEMISRCPSTFKNDDIAEKCTSEYYDIAFDRPLGLLLPVLDHFSGLIYKNSFCASCHNANSSSLSHGRLRYLCNIFTRKITYISDFTTIPDANAGDDCNFVFDPPEGADGYPWLSKICDRNYIDRCNVTGRWVSYDRQTENACLSYKSIYDRMFRNVHCFLCNGFDKNDVQQICELSDYYQIHIDSGYNFIKLLSWNKIEDIHTTQTFKYDKGINGKCSRGKILDPLKRDEWLLFCTQGMVEIDKMCLPPSDEPSTILIAINIILEPNTSLARGDHFTLKDIISTIHEENKQKLSMLISKKATIHNIKGTFQFKTNVDTSYLSTDTAFIWQNLQHVTVQTQFLTDKSEDELLTTILDFALGFTNISNYTDNFKARFNHIPHLDANEQSSNSNCFIKLKTPLYKLCAIQSDSGVREIHFEIVHKQLKLSIDLSRQIILEPEPFCPRVILPKQAFIPCNKSQFISNLYSKDFVSNALSENETHLLFCHEDYFNHLNTLQSTVDIIGENDGFGNYEQALPILTIACLSISILSLGLTLFVYTVYPALRSLPGLINMALVTSLIVFQLASFVRTIANINILWLCNLIGGVTHFSFILSFNWMFICTFHMFKVFVYIRNRAVGQNEFRKFMSYCILSFGVAITLVVITIVISLVRSDGKDVGYGGESCYIKDSLLILGLVALPIALVILLNIFMFCVVVYKIQKHPTLASSNPKERQNIIVFAKLSSITGMTWIFGFIYTITQIETFAFIFVILNAGQGVFIMLSFVCNKRVFDMACKKYSKRSTSRLATTSTDV